MHFRTAMCGGEPCSGSSGTTRNFWRAGSLGSRSFPVRAAVMRPASGRWAPLSTRAAPSLTRLYLRDDLPEDQCGLRAPAGAWLTADAPGILHPAGPGRGGGRAVGSVFPLEGGMGLRSRMAPSTWDPQIDGKREGLSDARRYA